ncbi:unnamed protein product [Acanthoscelides obtectus]|uniref:Uncharacterized protein n=1 Tax=Acanthoscelides obtectus TaxID=200917 RepID=A0A9P0LGJ3_ACAOB|nr:unnamed protein product [Acanthoscelides obtectus]CAK1655232.1 hypothetical protein AOBTE_LOCUS19091 [Acanthoscelides obtectus]
MLKEIRGTSDEQKKRKRGKKFKPGKEIDTIAKQAVTQDVPKDMGVESDDDELPCSVSEGMNISATSGIISKIKRSAPKQHNSNKYYEKGSKESR